MLRRFLLRLPASKRWQSVSVNRNFSNRYPWEKLLVANRGEIACRIIRTAKQQGLRTVAVASEADARALHVQQADEAIVLGPPPASESYLCIDKLILAAKASGATAVHPGYGFLSENADFAQACSDSGLTFIGPPASAIRAMGSKSESKRLMTAAGVRCVPGYDGADQRLATLAKEADRLGYPLIVKPIHGGGGKGMEIVHRAAQLPEAVAASKRVAKASFSNDEILLERYIERPRHVEVQIFADNHSNCIHLFDRDCSIQRRHQKVLEEAPAPSLPKAQREEMYSMAIRAAKAVNYRGAGTVEFIVDTKRKEFFYMETNCRLQVEHPVTEMITNLDLVKLQLDVAAGFTLPQQSFIQQGGHAIEVRICAEDPSQGFMPSVGTIESWTIPSLDRNVRLDTGFREGDEISVYYDSMIGKLIVFADNRNRACSRLIDALSRCEIKDLSTNLPLLRAIVQHPAFRQEELHTRFIQQHKSDLIQEQ